MPTNVQPLPLAPNTLRPPLITIDGAAVESTGFDWALTTGAEPYIGSFIISRDRMKAFWPPSRGDGQSVPASKTLRIEHESIIAGNTVLFKHQFIVYVIDAHPVDRENAMITVADRRVWWRGQTVTGKFNVPGRRNDAEAFGDSAQPALPGQAPGRVRFGAVLSSRHDVLLGDIIGRTLTTPRRRYYEWSLQYPIATIGAGAESIGVQQKALEYHWTALDLVRAILVGRWVATLEAPGNGSDPSVQWVQFPGIIDPGDLVIDGKPEMFNAYAPERVEWNCRPVADALAEMLALCRAGMFIRGDNKVVIYPIDDDDVNATRIPGGVKAAMDDGTLLVDGSGFLYRENNIAQRPESVTVCFDIERERDFVMVGGSVSDPRVAENVMQLHADRELTVRGETRLWRAGTYPPVRDVLSSYGISEETVNQHWHLQGHLAARIKETQGLDLTLPDLNIDGLVQSLLLHYRQTFRPLDEYADTILTIAPVLATVLNQYGLRAPAAVWCRYSVIPGFLVARQRKKDAIAGWNVDATDTNGIPAPFLVEVLDDELKIVRIVPREDTQNASVHLSIPCGFDESARIPPPHLSKDGANWGNVPLEEDFKLTARMSVRMAVPNNEQRFWRVNVPNTGLDKPGLAPPVTIYTDRDTARVDINDRLVNAGLVYMIAASEAKRIFLSWRDRYRTPPGGLRFAGGHKLVPWGGVSYVAWEYRDGQFDTVVDMSSPPAPPRATQLTDRRVQYFLERRPPIQ